MSFYIQNKDDNYLEYQIWVEGELNESLIKIQYFLKECGWLEQYIWQKDIFYLEITKSESNEVPSHLHGVVRYGENVEDEWFIVFLLYEISKKIPRFCY